MVSATVCSGLGGPKSRHHGALRVQNAEGHKEVHGEQALVQSHVCDNRFLYSIY